MKMLKTTVIATALLASSPLFANTDVSANASAEVGTNGGILSNIGQGIHNTADKVGNGLEKGVDKTREVSKDAWDGTKNTAAKVGTGVEKGVDKTRDVSKDAWDGTKNVADKVGTGVETGIDKGKVATKGAWENTKKLSSEAGHNTKEAAVKVKDKTKSATSKTWQKTKDLVKPKPANTGAKVNSQTHVKTPVGSAKVAVSTDAKVATK